MEHTPQEIRTLSEVIFNELKAHEDAPESTQIYQHDRDFTYIQVDHNYKPISDKEAKRQIIGLVHEELNRINQVFVYTCKDNSLITFEEFSQHELDTEPIYQAYEETNFPKLYMGYD